MLQGHIAEHSLTLPRLRVHATCAGYARLFCAPCTRTLTTSALYRQACLIRRVSAFASWSRPTVQGYALSRQLAAAHSNPRALHVNPHSMTYSRIHPEIAAGRALRHQNFLGACLALQPDCAADRVHPSGPIIGVTHHADEGTVDWGESADGCRPRSGRRCRRADAYFFGRAARGRNRRPERVGSHARAGVEEARMSQRLHAWLFLALPSALYPQASSSGRAGRR